MGLFCFFCCVLNESPHRNGGHTYRNIIFIPFIRLCGRVKSGPPSRIHEKYPSRPGIDWRISVAVAPLRHTPKNLAKGMEMCCCTPVAARDVQQAAVVPPLVVTVLSSQWNGALVRLVFSKTFRLSPLVSPSNCPRIYDAFHRFGNNVLIETLATNHVTGKKCEKHCNCPYQSGRSLQCRQFDLSAAKRRAFCCVCLIEMCILFSRFSFVLRAVDNLFM